MQANPIASGIFYSSASLPPYLSILLPLWGKNIPKKTKTSLISVNIFYNSTSLFLELYDARASFALLLLFHFSPDVLEKGTLPFYIYIFFFFSSFWMLGQMISTIRIPAIIIGLTATVRFQRQPAFALLALFIQSLCCMGLESSRTLLENSALLVMLRFFIFFIFCFFCGIRFLFKFNLWNKDNFFDLIKILISTLIYFCSNEIFSSKLFYRSREKRKQRHCFY